MVSDGEEQTSARPMSALHFLAKRSEKRLTSLLRYPVCLPSQGSIVRLSDLTTHLLERRRCIPSEVKARRTSGQR